MTYRETCVITKLRRNFNIKFDKTKNNHLGGITMAEEVLDIEMIAMTLIGHAGETKSLAYQAMNAAKAGKFDEAEEFMKQSTEEMLKAHELQTDMIAKEAGGEQVPVNIILIHSQDHLTMANVAEELAEEMISLYKTIADLKTEIEEIKKKI